MTVFQNTRRTSKNRAVVNVERERQINAAPEDVFAALSDTENLGRVLPRVKRVEVIKSGPMSARIATHMSLGPFGSIRSEGDVRWQTNREIVFSSSQPVPIETRWTLIPGEHGTHVRAELTLDLSSMMGPFSAFIPQENIAAMIGPDLDTTLGAVARLVEK